MIKFFSIIIGLILTCNSFNHLAIANQNNKIIIGAKTFTEQYILAKMLSVLLEKEGYIVEEQLNYPTHVIRQLLLNKNIDIYWEYTGTGYRALLQQTNINVSTDSEKVYQKVKEIDKQNGVIWLTKSPLNNTYAMVMKKEKSQEYSIQTMSDLSNKLKQKQKLVFVISKSFYYRPDGFQRLISYYNMPISKSSIFIITGDFHRIIKRGQVDIAEAYATDAKIKQYNLIIIEDDRHFFPAYNPAPIILEETLKKYPVIAEIAQKLAPLLDTETMINLNYLVEIKNKSIEEVARTWLKQKGLLQ